MKTFLKILLPVLFITLVFDTIISYQNGIGGHTRKNLNTLGDGCICHMADSTSSVLVQISGPAEVAPNSVNTYRITMRGGPAITGGFDFNVKFGNVDTVPGQETRKIVETFDSINDISQSWSKFFTGDSVSWLVKYIAPNTTVNVYDTLYATGNSCNNNGAPDDSDKWNFSPNFVVLVNPTIGIQPVSSVAEKYNLAQNYPNPFNPATNIQFHIPSTSFVKLAMYDVLGREITVLVDEELKPGIYKADWDGTNYPSGVYYYKFSAGDFNETKRMVLAK